MRAVTFDGRQVRVEERPVPRRPEGWALIRPTRVGVCRTDIEITRGYMGFEGTLGHEFVGVVEECDDADWIGKRVVGDINAGCRVCEVCRRDGPHHCARRSVLGILGHDGCMAELLALPVANLVAVQPSLHDDRAVFAEPVAAAFEIVEQLPLSGRERCIVLGDGKLGILCAWVLHAAGLDVTLIGRHERKLEIARSVPIAATTDPADLAGADIVVEATGRAAGLSQAVGLCRPRGTVVLKSTIADSTGAPLMEIVVNEITLVGSRCGPVRRAAAELAAGTLPVEKLIEARFPLASGDRAVAKAAEPGVLKVVIESPAGA